MYHLQLFLTIASLVSCRSETSGGKKIILNQFIANCLCCKFRSSGLSIDLVISYSVEYRTYCKDSLFLCFTEETLQCICTTATCQEIGEPICVTSGLCYTQFLDKKDGSDPVTKGCVR